MSPRRSRQRERPHEPREGLVRIPVPAEIAPLDLTLSLIRALCANYSAEVIEADVIGPTLASFTMRIPAPVDD